MFQKLDFLSLLIFVNFKIILRKYEQLNNLGICFPFKIQYTQEDRYWWRERSPSQNIGSLHRNSQHCPRERLLNNYSTLNFSFYNHPPQLLLTFYINPQ